LRAFAEPALQRSFERRETLGIRPAIRATKSIRANGVSLAHGARDASWNRVVAVEALL
jgi:hypothetical protein